MGLAEFTELYGFGPQEFVNLSAVGMALPPSAASAQAEVTKTKAAVKAFGDQDAINAAIGPGADEKRRDLALAVNHAAAAVETLHNITARVKYAREFAEGTLDWGGFRSYFGTFQQGLIDEGNLHDGTAIDPKSVLAAVKAALGIES